MYLETSECLAAILRTRHFTVPRAWQQSCSSCFPVRDLNHGNWSSNFLFVVISCEAKFLEDTDFPPTPQEVYIFRW